MEEKSLDSNRGVVNRLIRGRLDFIANLAAVAVNSVANSVYKAVGVSLNLNGRQIFQILVNLYILQ